eukprot:CCRYP_010160-RA/>CCRYP_010160-RA protein AED:0.43 eAED:0.43 QI:0/0/0/0.5/1/1/2/0/569
MSEKQPDTDNTVRDLPIDDLETPGLQIPRIPTEEECQEASDDEFRTQFYSNLEKRLVESRENSQNFRPLFKTKAEALETIRLIEDWNAFTSDGKKRKRCAHTRHQYRLREKFELAIGSGTNCLRHRQTGCRVAIYEDLFDVIRDAHVGMGHARTARNILLELKNSWFGITAADVQLVIDLCPTCIGNTSRIKTSQTPLKMLFSPTIGHRAQVDLVDMTSNETEDGFKWIVRYRDHHSGKCDVGATKGKTAAEVAPVVIRIMASTLIPNILQSDNGGEFLGETVAMVNRSSLRELDLHLMLTERGWQMVSDVLSSPMAALTVFELHDTDIPDECADAFARGLAHNTTLEELTLNYVNITAEGWRVLISSLRNPHLKLNCIDVSSNTMNDDTVSLLSEGLVAKSDTIVKFNVCCEDITAAGWMAFSAAFRTPMPNMNALSIGNPSFNDDAFAALSNGLKNMPSLKTLHIITANDGITTGWEALSKVLCDRSSLDTIRESNHTLHEVTCPCPLPSNIKKLLEMNRSGTAYDAARLKIIEYSDKITIDTLVDDQLVLQRKLVPSVVSWLGKDP